MARDRISGPFGLWPFPVLNTLIILSENNPDSGDVNVTDRDSRVYNVQRDNDGNIRNVTVEE